MATSTRGSQAYLYLAPMRESAMPMGMTGYQSGRCSWYMQLKVLTSNTSRFWRLA